MPEEGSICAKPTEKRAGGRGGPQINHQRAVLYSEGLLRKSRLFIKETEVGLSSEQVGTEGASSLQWSHVEGGVGRAVGLAEATYLFSQETMQRGGHAWGHVKHTMAGGAHG